MRAVLFVDGFNLYHSLDTTEYNRFKWLDLRELGNQIIRDSESLAKVLYFSTYVKWDKQKKLRHQLYVKALSERGVQRVKGEFMPVTKEFVRGRK